MTRAEAGKLGGLQSSITSQKNYQRRINNYLQNPKKCISCNKSLNYKQRYNKYCSHLCAAKEINTSRIKSGFYSRNITKVCPFCGKLVNKRDNKYCNECILKNYHRHKKTNLKDAKSDRTRHKILLEMLGRRCYVCGNIIWNNKPIPVELEHKDGNSQNNEESNLELICPNCHAQTPTYKGKNFGNGRYRRRQRYKEGKSY